MSTQLFLRLRKPALHHRNECLAPAVLQVPCMFILESISISAKDEHVSRPAEVVMLPRAKEVAKYEDSCLKRQRSTVGLPPAVGHAGPSFPPLRIQLSPPVRSLPGIEQACPPCLESFLTEKQAGLAPSRQTHLYSDSEKLQRHRKRPMTVLTGSPQPCRTPSSQHTAWLRSPWGRGCSPPLLLPCCLSGQLTWGRM